METLLSCCLHDPARESLIYIPRFTHRLSLIKAWEITPGQHILDIGCGQGESCLALAVALGPSSHITGIDDAHPEYGTPFTVRESQLYIAKSALGPRITFTHTDAPSLLRQLPDSDGPLGTAYDAAVLCHSLWYFPSRSSVSSLFRALVAGGIPLVYVAEYTYQPSETSQLPHVLAAQAMALLSSCKTPLDFYQDLRASNVRAAMDQASILEVARDAGFTVRRQGTVTPEADMLEGHFEARHVTGDAFLKTVKDKNLPREQEAEILGLAARVREEMDGLSRRGVATVRAMDSWWAVLDLNPAAQD